MPNVTAAIDATTMAAIPVLLALLATATCAAFYAAGKARGLRDGQQQSKRGARAEVVPEFQQ